jgi:predicted HAD superfamily hydrolase
MIATFFFWLISLDSHPENKGREIEFFPQSHMYEVARDEEKKNKLIQGIVEKKDKKNNWKAKYFKTSLGASK